MCNCKKINGTTGLIGIRTATFFLKGNGTKVIDLTAVHDLLKDKTPVGISFPTVSNSPEGLTVSSTENLFIDLVDSTQSFLNTKLPVRTPRAYEAVGRFYPICSDVSFQYSKLNLSANLAESSCICVTVHYDNK